MRLISLPEEYKPIIHDVLKTATILMVVEIIQFLRKGDPLLDKVLSVKFYLIL